MSSYHIPNFNEKENQICEDITKSIYKSRFNIGKNEFKFSDKKLARSIAMVLTDRLSYHDEADIFKACNDFAKSGLKDLLESVINNQAAINKKNHMYFINHMDNIPLSHNYFPVENQTYALIFKRYLEFHEKHPQSSEKLYDTLSHFRQKHYDELLEVFSHLNKYSNDNGELLGNPRTLVFLARNKDLWQQLIDKSPDYLDIPQEFASYINQRTQLQHNHHQSKALLELLLEEPESNYLMVFDIMSSRKPSEIELENPSYLWTNLSFVNNVTCYDWYKRLSPNRRNSHADQVTAENLLKQFNSLSKKDLVVLEKSMMINSAINGGSSHIEDIIPSMNTNTLKSLINKLYISPSDHRNTEKVKTEKNQYSQQIHAVYALPNKYWEKAMSDKLDCDKIKQVREMVKTQDFHQLDTLLTPTEKVVKPPKPKTEIHPLAKKLKGM